MMKKFIINLGIEKKNIDNFQEQYKNCTVKLKEEVRMFSLI